ncbi:hypothetical protein HPB48_006453 [Haemaphysalis longicornis]|uniref:Mon2 C-terminal domain-containing protein n=1 Tax=Haemaphysalis longicornis TaxID=44386 RepID=A0A9J6FKM7_HAELO|nr:hypothetical protein HPB48_006453 [Haemaphysalis longicornis]
MQLHTGHVSYGSSLQVVQLIREIILPHSSHVPKDFVLKIVALLNKGSIHSATSSTPVGTCFGRPPLLGQKTLAGQITGSARLFLGIVEEAVNCDIETGASPHGIESGMVEVI